MGILADRLKVIKPSPTIAVTNKARELNHPRLADWSTELTQLESSAPWPTWKSRLPSEGGSFANLRLPLWRLLFTCTKCGPPAPRGQASKRWLDRPMPRPRGGCPNGAEEQGKQEVVWSGGRDWLQTQCALAYGPWTTEGARDGWEAA